jgi:hypothetical protein
MKEWQRATMIGRLLHMFVHTTTMRVAAAKAQGCRTAEPKLHDLLAGVVAPTQHSHCSMQNLA